MEILDKTVSYILWALLIATPWLIIFFRARANKKTGFIYINAVALPIVFLLVILIAYWPHFFKDLRLELLGFDFDGTSSDERTRDVDPAYKEEAIKLYNSHMGIGWPLQAILGMVYITPYPTIVLVIIKMFFAHYTALTGIGLVNRGQWSLKQHLSMRASTMLLLSLFLIPAFYWAKPLLPRLLSPFFEGIGMGMFFIALLISIFGLAFFIASIVKRNPQLQYFIEFVAGVALIFLTPTY